MHALVKFSHSSKALPKLSLYVKMFHSRVSQRVTEVPLSQPHQIKKIPLILKSFAFTVGVSGACFSAATIAQYERIKENVTTRRRSEKYSKTRTELNELWNSLSGVKKIVVGIICINSAVLLCGRVLTRPMTNGTGDALRSILLNNFCLSPTSSKRRYFYKDYKIKNFNQIRYFIYLKQECHSWF